MPREVWKKILNQMKINRNWRLIGHTRKREPCCQLVQVKDNGVILRIEWIYGATYTALMSRGYLEREEGDNYMFKLKDPPFDFEQMTQEEKERIVFER
jgi:hypothetical protein